MNRARRSSNPLWQAAAPVPTADQPIWTVSQAAACVREVLGQLPAKVRVVGEVSNLSDRHHWYFSLKDEQASLRCVCFASSAAKVRFDVRDGITVVATGRFDFYAAQGQVQLYVDKLEPVGLGELEQRLRALIAELKALGWMDPALRKPLPVLPRRVALVTSRSGAAVVDFVRIARERCPSCQLLLADVRVQGAAAAPEIAATIRQLGAQAKSLGLDALVLTRGGGSMEDLWAFNERIVAEAIHACPLPVVAAIGHEVDVTVAELVADVRCATPSHAAETLLPDQDALVHQLDQLGHRLALDLRRRLRHADAHLAALSRHRLIRQPQRLLDDAAVFLKRQAQRQTVALNRLHTRHTQQLDALAQRLRRSLPMRLARETQLSRERMERFTAIQGRWLKPFGRQVDALQGRLAAVDPQRVLERGYTLTLDARGQILRSAADVSPGARLTTTFADGKIDSIVTEASASAPPAPRRRKARHPDDEPPGLFAGSDG